MSKSCYKCKQIKPLLEFHKDKSRKDGHRHICKDCVRLKIGIDQDNRKSYLQNYYKENREKLLQYSKDNKEHIIERQKEYRQKNLEKVRAWERKSYKRNPESHIKNSRERRAKKKLQSPEVSILESELIKSLYVMARILGNSCGEKFHVDHIHPISKGGLHVFDNLQILSAEENLKKGSSIC